MHLALPLLDGNVEVPDFGNLLLHGRQLVVVRGKERLRAELFGVDRVLQNRFGNRHAVKGRRAASDFVENQKRPWRRVFENVCHLVHFHHERRLPRGKIVGRADARKELIDNADARACRGHEASHLRH